MSGKWTRNQKIAALSVIITASGIIIGLFLNTHSSINQSIGDNNKGAIIQQANSPNSPITLNPTPTTAEKFLQWADSLNSSIREKIIKKQYKFAGFLNPYHLGEIQRIASEDKQHRIQVSSGPKFNEASNWPPDEFGDAPKPSANGYNGFEISSLTFVGIEVDSSVFAESPQK